MATMEPAVIAVAKTWAITEAVTPGLMVSTWQHLPGCGAD
jgi:hypothetical protein